MFVPGVPGTGALQETGSPLLDPVIDDDVISMRLSITRARTILLALTPVEFCNRAVQRGDSLAALVARSMAGLRCNEVCAVYGAERLSQDDAGGRGR